MSAIAFEAAAAEPTHTQDTSTETTEETPLSLHALIRASAIGATYDWINVNSHATLFHLNGDGSSVATPYSSFSVGPGIKLGAGTVIRSISRNLSLSGAVEYVYAHYDTTLEPNDLGLSKDQTAALHLFDLELRVILDEWKVKPFFALTPGLATLDLPNQEVVLASNPSEENRTVDAWKAGISAAVSLGALYEIAPSLMLEGSLGYRMDSFNRTNEGSYGQYREAAQSFVLTMGVEWWP